MDNKQPSRAAKNQQMTYHTVNLSQLKERKEVEIFKVTLYSPSANINKMRNTQVTRDQNTSITSYKNTLNKSIGNTTTYSGGNGVDKSLTSSMKTMNISTHTGRNSHHKMPSNTGVATEGNSKAYMSPQNKNMDLLTKLLNKELADMMASKKKSLEKYTKRASGSPLSSSSQRRSDYTRNAKVHSNLIIQPKQKKAYGNF